MFAQGVVPRGRRVGKLVMSGSLVASIFQAGIRPGMWVKDNPLPDDAKLIQITMDDCLRIVAIFESESFAEVLEGDMIPNLPMPNFWTYHEESYRDFHAAHPELWTAAESEFALSGVGNEVALPVPELSVLLPPVKPTEDEGNAKPGTIATVPLRLPMPVTCDLHPTAYCPKCNITGKVRRMTIGNFSGMMILGCCCPPEMHHEWIEAMLDPKLTKNKGSVPSHPPTANLGDVRRVLGICPGCQVVGVVKPFVVGGVYRARVEGCRCPAGTNHEPEQLR